MITQKDRTFKLIANKSDICAICLGEKLLGELVYITPCKHEYHAHCISEWLPVSNSCPYCRQSI